MSKLWWRLVRFGFRLLYNELAFTYDWVSSAVSLGEWRCWQRSALKHLRPTPEALILELAHGTGSLQLDLYQAGYKTVGYDLSPYMGRIARRKLARHGLPAPLVRGRAQQLPFASGTFGAVISTFPTNFITAPDTLHEVSRVLRADGQFIIVPNGILTGREIKSRSIEWLYQITGQREGSSMNVNTFFEQYGFQVESHQEKCSHSLAQVIVATKKV